jgi:hypothetical protein
MTVAPTRIHGSTAPTHRPRTLIIAAVLVAFVVVLALVLLGVFDGSSSSTGSSGVQGSGVAATQTRSVAPFTSVELAGSNNVTIRTGARQAVLVHADDNLVTRVTTQVHAGSLLIGNTAGSFTTNNPMTVEISVPSLKTLTLSGSGNISASGIRTPLAIALPGSGVVYASGTTPRLDVTIGGSGDAQLTELVARHVHAVVSGSGAIFVTATKSLDASVPGSGAIIYGGSPARVTTSVTGAGAVTPG